MKPRAWITTLTWAACPLSVGAQALSERISTVEDGVVRITYPAREGVEVCDQGVRMGERHLGWRGDDSGPWGTRCRSGPIELEIHLRDGDVRDVEVVTRPEERRRDAVEFGAVSADEAAHYLLDVARRGEGSGAREAIFPAVLADVDGLWRELIDLARDGEVRRGVRKNALFWVGQEAATAATEGLADVAFDEDEDQDVRDAAVFALSQRPAAEGVPVLMEVARTAHEAKTRRTAMFWLAQSDDERVVDFFEDILLGHGGR